MTNWVLPECVLRPLPRIYARPRTGFPSSTAVAIKIRAISVPKSHILGPKFRVSAQSGDRNWALNVSAPLRVAIPEEEEEEKGAVVINGVEDGGEFNPGAPPPFKLADIRAAS